MDRTKAKQNLHTKIKLSTKLDPNYSKNWKQKNYNNDMLLFVDSPNMIQNEMGERRDNNKKRIPHNGKKGKNTAN